MSKASRAATKIRYGNVGCSIDPTEYATTIIDAEFDAAKLAKWLVEHRLLQVCNRIDGRETKEVAIVALAAAIKQWMEE